jgi:flagellar transcriptional activator FlhD
MGIYMETLLQDIRETNLSYLMLAQNMIRKDRAQALYRLGISGDVADVIDALTPGQLVKAAGSNMLMCRFRFDDKMVWNLITSHGQDVQAKRTHAGILMSGNLAEVI